MRRHSDHIEPDPPALLQALAEALRANGRRTTLRQGNARAKGTWVVRVSEPAKPPGKGYIDIAKLRLEYAAEEIKGVFVKGICTKHFALINLSSPNMIEHIVEVCDDLVDRFYASIGAHPVFVPK